MKQKRSRVLCVCAIVLCALWTGNTILSMWRLEIGRNAGLSMLPTFGDGALYAIQMRPSEVRKGDIVEAGIAVDGRIERVVKRVVEVAEDRIFLEGDNKADTWRGWVPISAIEGKVVAVLWRGHTPVPQVSAAPIAKSKRASVPYSCYG